MFTLHPQLAADTWLVGHLPLCDLLLAKDANYPWFILVPRVADISEIHQLAASDQHRLIDESSRLARQLEKNFAADKINIGALGNLVPQLHLHHVARYRHDAAWPGPIWGAVAAREYSEDERIARIEQLQPAGLAGFNGAPT